MITEDKVTEIFCIADDFCKVLMHRWQNIRLRQKGSANISVKVRWRQWVHWKASFRKALCGWHTTYNETEE